MNDMMTLLPDIKLRFNIEHPSFEECYTYGYECALAEIGEEENPFSHGSKEHEQWLEGWWAGLYGEEPLLQISTEGDSQELNAANDQRYYDGMTALFIKVIELTGIIAVSAIVGYQVYDLVA